MERFNVVIKGYCDVTLAIYSVEAETKSEAIEKAEKIYMSNMDTYVVSDEEAEKIREEIDDEDDDDDDE